MTDTLFDLPETKLSRPPEPILRAAEVDGNCRWTLSRRWSAKPIVAFCGCNPSYADAKRDDPTLWRVMGFAFRWGFGGLVMLNVYPFITPDIAELRRIVAIETHATIMAIGENAERVLRALRQADLHVACWGNLIEPAEAADFYDGLNELSGSPVTWHCIGTTSNGSPTHPMARGKHRVPDDARAVQWRPNFQQ